MSGEPSKLGPAPAPSDTQSDPEDRGYRSRSSWPVTRGAAAGMTLLLGLAVAGPALARALGSDLWLALLLPGLLATLTARLVFESVDGALTRTAGRAHLIAAAAGAAVGALVMAAAALILGIQHADATELAPLALALLALVSAGPATASPSRSVIPAAPPRVTGQLERLR